MSATERSRAGESAAATGPESEAPKSGVRNAPVLMPPRPREKALPGREVPPAPGVPEPPRGKRHHTSQFWPAPPEPMKPADRPSKRGTPLTTTSHGFPELAPRTASEPAKRIAKRVERPVEAPKAEVAPSRLESAPPPPKSKRTHTDIGWPPPSGRIPSSPAIEPRVANDVEVDVEDEVAVVPPLALTPPAELETESTVLAPTFDEEDDFEIPIVHLPARARWIAIGTVVLTIIGLIATFAR